MKDCTHEDDCPECGDCFICSEDECACSFCPECGDYWTYCDCTEDLEEC